MGNLTFAVGSYALHEVGVGAQAARRRSHHARLSIQLTVKQAAEQSVACFFIEFISVHQRCGPSESSTSSIFSRGQYVRCDV